MSDIFQAFTKILFPRQWVSWLSRKRFEMHHKTSGHYWDSRYRKGGTSGEGSYGRLAEFKAKIINEFIKEFHINSVMEFGCGDGNQLSLIHYPRYTGLDVSSRSIKLCQEKFKDDSSKLFILYSAHTFNKTKEYVSDLTLSLDVIYHLLEDKIYTLYMSHLFECSQKYVIIYSTNYEKQTAPHVKHRMFSNWIKVHCRDWKLLKKINNQFPIGSGEKATSFADFYIYAKF